jgi:hypothetical protein
MILRSKRNIMNGYIIMHKADLCVLWVFENNASTSDKNPYQVIQQIRILVWAGMWHECVVSSYISMAL